MGSENSIAKEKTGNTTKIHNNILNIIVDLVDMLVKSKFFFIYLCVDLGTNVHD
jgi:hypothetical protein